MPQSSREAGKHRRPGKHRKQVRAAHQPGAPALMGTAVVASAAAALLHVPAAAGSDTPTSHAQSIDSADAALILQKTAAAAPAVQAQTAVTHATAQGSSTASSANLSEAAGPAAAAQQALMLKNLRSGPRASRSLSAQQRAITIKKLQAPAVLWVKPVVSYNLTAGFGEASRLWSHRHTGQDFAAPTGTPVHVVGDGTIVSAQWDGAYGRKIVVRHADGTETWYCHLSAFEAKLGDVVKMNDVIGLVGATGNTTGPHLHFEVRPTDGDPIEPMAWLRAHGVNV